MCAEGLGFVGGVNSLSIPCSPICIDWFVTSPFFLSDFDMFLDFASSIEVEPLNRNNRTLE